MASLAPLVSATATHAPPPPRTDEGAGIFRPTHLVRSALVRIADDGVFAPANVTGAIHARGAPADGLTSDGASVAPIVSLENPNGGAGITVGVLATLYAADGATVLATSARHGTALQPVGSAAVVLPPLTFTNASLWSIARPYLHTLVTQLVNETAPGAPVIDATNVTVGIRSLRWDGPTGLFINEQHVKLRGMCNHASFAGFGMAVPTRVNLLRLQQLRGIGGNSWRMSHNPGTPGTFELGDRLGVTFLDENRVFEDEAPDIANMGDMVRRDRKHASVIWYSFCNEGGAFAGRRRGVCWVVPTPHALDASPAALFPWSRPTSQAAAAERSPRRTSSASPTALTPRGW